MPRQSKYPGVYWHPKLRRWVVQFTVLVGAFVDEEEAIAARKLLDRETAELQREIARRAGLAPAAAGGETGGWRR